MTFVGKLYPFQAEAVERMVEAKSLLLGMEMGLGKTVCVIAAVEELIERGEVAGGFVICPNSVKLQWARLIDQFTGGEADVLVVSGDARHRQEIYRAYKQGEAQYLILNPEAMVNDWEFISKLARDYICCDEATWFKNFSPQRSKKVKRLHARYQWALTGQPIENRAEEIFSIMEWVNPEVLGNFRTFDRAFIKRDHFGRVRVYKNLPVLHRLISNVMVRHTRDEIADQMPAVSEATQLIDLDDEGARLYRKIVADLERDLEEALNTWGNFSLHSFYRGEGQNEARGDIMSKLVNLRMLCDHPELLRISAARFRGELPGRNMGSAYAEELHANGKLERATTSPKLKATVELLSDILEADPRNKVVVFSHFVSMLDILAEATAGLVKSVIFSGRINTTERDRVKQQFATDPDVRLFLSSDAGGIGLDLPMANYLISYDLPWSAGAYAQRQARIIRLSSEWPKVTLISMQVAGSIEVYQDGLLRQKRKVADAVIDGRGINPKGRLNLDLKTLSQFLRESVV